SNGLLPADTPYFNAGVVLFNLEAMRQANIEQRFADIAQKHGRLTTYADQDILNIACSGRVYWLPLRFNVQSNFYYKSDALSRLEHYRPGIAEEFHQALADPAILHFTGREKPWHIGSRHPMTEAYLEIERTSPWRGAPLLVDTLRYRRPPLAVRLGNMRRWLAQNLTAGKRRP
ncbi:MAG: hypothetical protein KDJ16_17820, partial [Hyphomicrobiales bacterium]|nr:hypothetical protein [Hyphomicrobiales bacterium]